MDSPTLNQQYAASTRSETVTAPPGFWYLFAAVAAACLWQVEKTSSDLGWVAFATAATPVAILVSAIRRRRTNGQFVLEPPLLIVLVLYLWHFAFWIVYFVGLSSWYRVPQYLDFVPDATASAALQCLSAALALIAGIEFGVARVGWRPVPTIPARTLVPYAGLIAGGSASVGYYLLGGSRLHGNYAAVFTEEDSRRRLYNLGVVLLLAGLGPLLHFDTRGRRRVAMLLLGCIPTLVVSALLGSRWVIFSAALLVLMARSMRGAKMPWLRLGLAFVILVEIGTVIKHVRAGDIENLADVGAVLVGQYTNPIVEFFEEIGQTFIAVVGVNGMHAQGAPYLGGASYADALASIVPSLPSLVGIHVVRPMHDLAAYYFYDKYATQGYTIGYSAVAELYVNFGIVGVVAGMSAIGGVLGHLYRRYLVHGTYRHLFTLYAAVGVLIFGVRNDAFTWLRDAVWACLLMWVVGRRVDLGRAT
jgi:hypothetical protein